MELTEDFLKMLSIAISVVGILGIFFIFLQYNIVVEVDETHRAAVSLGDSLLANPCLTEIEIINGKEYPIKGLFSESKLDSYADCINYDRGDITIKYLDSSKTWDISLSTGTVSTESLTAQTTYFISIKNVDGHVKMASMVVSL